MRINRNKVHSSMWVPVIAVFILIILSGLIHAPFSSKGIDVIGLFGFSAILMLFGAVVWLPCAFICLIIERVGINERTTKLHVLLILFFEALIPFVICIGLMNHASPSVIILIFIIAMLGQSARWFYLLHNGRMYAMEKIGQTPSNELDIQFNPKS